MSRRSARNVKKARSPAPPVNRDAVEAMAYQIWLHRGAPLGSDQEDWYRAEAELKAVRPNPRAA
jgi:hypothetical protein